MILGKSLQLGYAAFFNQARTPEVIMTHTNKGAANTDLKCLIHRLAA
jgi:hypothetical protein